MKIVRKKIDPTENEKIMKNMKWAMEEQNNGME
jgi:hypothetical protein